MNYIILGIGIFLFLVILWIISVSNKLNVSLVKIDESISGIDVALAKRYDVLTKMIEVVKGYAKHEKEVLFKVIELRDNMSMNEKNKANQNMDENFRKISILVENYPELKASENFKILQQTIVDVEEHLQAARRLYNANVSHYNEIVLSFPTCIIAKSKKLVKKDFFEAEEKQKENIQIDLS